MKSGLHIGLASSLLVILLATACVEDNVSISVSDDLFDQGQPDTLGLQKPDQLATFTVYEPRDGDNAYNHGVVLFPFQGVLYAQWQTSLKDEDSADTHVVYAWSEDEGETWSEPVVLYQEQEDAIATSGGWWVNEETLVAFINVWPEREDEIRQGYTLHMTSEDGRAWSRAQAVTGKDGEPVPGVIEQDPHTIEGGRIVTAFHVEPGLTVAPYFTDDPLATSGWQRGRMDNLEADGHVSREIEPSLYSRPDGSVVMLFRDQDSSFQTLYSVSRDAGESWTTPELSAFPDSRSKQSAGNLPDGTVFRVNNPVPNRARYPLVVSLSEDGALFDRAWLLRAGGEDMQPMRSEGLYKRPSYSYPKSIVWGDYLFVAYATNKEDVEITRVPWQDLVQE
ncbi:exo-alpha-sialidase [Parvularcula flava]|uniref:Exo-alpha-sialidase n=1 Tax=Aquisalinus luteolus TaxID=1566827 RepID=A0A8J3EQ09_9PROT|nr:sialidase family protein [Aquisalinus luteolus]NHK26433.1 exo-alpha-sialidase [Aquisalinus luteolus]GGH92319.1 hypothetical protein GCM10011355_01540 [Aquisalinus luteolus]